MFFEKQIQSQFLKSRFNGDCEKAFMFYHSVLGGDPLLLNRFSEMPSFSDYSIPTELQHKIMHVSLVINDQFSIFGSDTIPGFGPPIIKGNNFSISVNLSSKDESDHIFKSLAKEGKIVMPLSDTFWGSYFGMLIDQFGIQWMISYDLTQQNK